MTAPNEITCSFIIVSWNTKQFLLDCLESLYKHTDGYSVEVIVVDNASTDGSPDVIADRFPQVKLIRCDSNLGFARANNIGLRTCRGDYVYLINSDVLILPECVRRTVQFMEEHRRVGLVGPRVWNPDRSLQLSAYKRPGLWRSVMRALALDKLVPSIAFHSHGRLEDVDVLTGCFWMVRREALEEVGELDESFFMYAEDLDWCRRFTDTGWRVMYFPDAEIIHFGGASSGNAPVHFYVQMNKADLQYWRKHHGLVGQLSYGIVLFFHQLFRIARSAVVFALSRKRRTVAGYKIRRSAACLGWLCRVAGSGRAPSELP